MSPHHYCLYNDQVLGIGWRREAVLGEVATPAWTVDTSNPYIILHLPAFHSSSIQVTFTFTSICLITLHRLFTLHHTFHLKLQYVYSQFMCFT